MGDLSLRHRFEPAPGGVTLLLLHGTGGDEDDLLPLARDLIRDLAAEASLLAPRGPVLEQGMPRWFRRHAPGVYDLEDVERRAGELAAFCAAAAEEYGFDPARLWALGYSNGANIALALAQLHPQVLAGGLLLRPARVLDRAPAGRLDGRSFLMAAGESDPYGPREELEDLAAGLRAAGAAVELHWMNAGHGLTAGDLVLGRDWLRRRLSVPRDPGDSGNRPA